MAPEIDDLTADLAAHLLLMVEVIEKLSDGEDELHRLTDFVGGFFLTHKRFFYEPQVEQREEVLREQWRRYMAVAAEATTDD